MKFFTMIVTSVVLRALLTASLMAMMLAGVYRTGETARAAMFIYPLLIPSVGMIFPPELISVNRKATMFIATLFFQGLIMQLIGDYFW